MKILELGGFEIRDEVEIVRGAHVAVLGVPFLSSLVGQDNDVAPRNVRISGLKYAGTFLPELGIDPMKRLRGVDYGDVDLRLGDMAGSLSAVETAVGEMVDAGCLPVTIGGNAPADSYLRSDRIIDAAKSSGADAIHPGYGFLAENEEFAEACRQAGLTFIGPTAEAIALMGSKTAARQTAIRAGVPVVPGLETPLAGTATEVEWVDAAKGVGYPLLVKAVAGGGGKGMRLVSREADLPEAIRTARSEAQTAFGDAAVYLEHALVEPRHVEVQLLGDHHGTIVPFVERECSIQRRHQKVVEESPSVAVGDTLRRAIAGAAANVARSVGYTNAGTIEFPVDPSAGGAFYFLEMNTRLQVEHGVTEAVTGADLVKAQIRSADGEKLSAILPEKIALTGHAVQARVYAEDPKNFFPSPGRLKVFRLPEDPAIRIETGYAEGRDVTPFYDPMVAKVIVHGATREQAVDRLIEALKAIDIQGIKHNIPAVIGVLESDAFRSG